MTMVSWLIDTSLPRIDAGAISAMYSGDRFDARPIPTPPASRLSTNPVNEPARAVPIDESMNIKPARTSSRLRPNRSARAPERIAPPRQPIRALLIAQPTPSGVIK